MGLHRFNFSGRTRAATLLFSPALPDTRPAFQRRVLCFLSLVNSFRHGPIISALAKINLTRWLLPMGYSQYLPMGWVGHKPQNLRLTVRGAPVKGLYGNGFRTL